MRASLMSDVFEKVDLFSKLVGTIVIETFKHPSKATRILVHKNGHFKVEVVSDNSRVNSEGEPVRGHDE